MASSRSPSASSSVQDEKEDEELLSGSLLLAVNLQCAMKTKDLPEVCKSSMQFIRGFMENELYLLVFWSIRANCC